MPIVLPTEPSKINKNWIDQKFAMIGPPGIGKSEFWSHGEKTLYLQTEAGLNHLSVLKIPIHSYQDLKETMTALIQANQSGKFPYDCIVVDTIDELRDILDEEVIRRGREKYPKQANEINSIGDIPNGTGWQWDSELFKLIFDKLEALPAATCYIGHQGLIEIKTATDKYHKTSLSIPGPTTRGFLVSWPDHFMNLESTYQGSKLVRKVRTLPNQYLDAKSRGGLVPDNWIWSENSKENYDKFRALFS